MENTYTAITEQGDDWWVIQLEEYPEIITQTRRLDQIPDMVRDALTLFPEITKDPENATIVIQVQGEVEELAKQARELDQQAKKLQEQASNCMRDTVQKARRTWSKTPRYRNFVEYQFSSCPETLKAARLTVIK